MYSVLLGAKGSIERPRLRASLPFLGTPPWKETVLAIESLRIDFNLGTRQVDFDTPEFSEYLLKLSVGLDAILSEELHRDLLLKTQFFLGAVPTSDRDRLRGVYDARQTVWDALTLLGNRVKGIALDDVLAGRTHGVALRTVVPAQKLAPIQFDIVGNQLRIARPVNSYNEEDANNIALSKEEIVSSGHRIVEELKRSNCDRRLLDTIIQLNERILQDDNIIAVGILNINCQMMCSSFDEELPSALKGMLQGQHVAVNMYVAQFSEWQRFSDNAAQAQLDVSDVQYIASATDLVIRELENAPTVSDAEVPKTLRALRSLLEDPGRASLRAAFAVLRSIENLVAKIYQYGADFLDQTIRDTIKSTASVSGKIVAGTLLTMAVTAAATLTPVGVKIGELAWMKAATEIVQKSLPLSK